MVASFFDLMNSPPANGSEEITETANTAEYAVTDYITYDGVPKSKKKPEEPLPQHTFKVGDVIRGKSTRGFWNQNRIGVVESLTYDYEFDSGGDMVKIPFVIIKPSEGTLQPFSRDVKPEYMFELYEYTDEIDNWV